LLPADVHLAPVGLRHDVLEVLRHKVDDMDLRRLLRGDRHALADGLHRPLDVAPPPVRNRLAERRGEILDLLSEDSLDLLPLPAPARAIASCTKSATAGLIVPSMTMRDSASSATGSAANTTAASSGRASATPRVTRTRPRCRARP